MKRYFGMVTTGPSSEYTIHALSSFFATTRLAAEDRFFLIDNDGKLPDDVLRLFRERLALIPNDTPLGFAANVNQILRRAAADSADLYFLNNDVVFSADWSGPFDTEESCILCPLSNRDLNYRTNVIDLETVMSLADYTGRESAFALIAAEHRKQLSGYKDYLVAPFFVVKIPHAVYQVVGEFDEAFGMGGGEDYDYCLRSYLAGFSVRVALGSYLLHFGGKSSWSGVESSAAQLAREQLFFDAFRKKWGERLFDVVLRENRELLSGSALDERARECFEQRDFRGLIELLR